jgi:cyanophycinase-like exopeptidase
MTQAGPLRWLSGLGWLVLGGGGDWQEGETGEVDTHALALVDPSRPVAYLPTAHGSISRGEIFLDYYADLGGPQGYVVPILSPVDARRAENRRLLAGAGLIYIDDGDALDLTRALWESPALEGIAEAFAVGAIVVGMGAGAAALGAWVIEPGEPGAGGPGWGWVAGTVVVPAFSGAEDAPALQAALRARPGSIGMGVPPGGALALGPQGKVETWGEAEVTVVVAR